MWILAEISGRIVPLSLLSPNFHPERTSHGSYIRCLKETVRKWLDGNDSLPTHRETPPGPGGDLSGLLSLPSTPRGRTQIVHLSTVWLRLLLPSASLSVCGHSGSDCLPHCGRCSEVPSPGCVVMGNLEERCATILSTVAGVSGNT